MLSKLRFQILMALLVFGVINIFIVLLNQFESKSKDNIENIEDYIHSIELLIFKDAQVINDFFTCETRQSDYFKNHESKYLNSHKELIEKILIIRQKLIRAENFNKINSDSLVYNISSNIDSLVIKMDSMTNLIYLRGFKDYGIEGKMRDHAHALEKLDGILLSDVLMLRRHEKDYIIRNEEKYIGQFHERIRIVEEFVSKNSKLSLTQQNAILTEVRNYEQTFNKMVWVDRLAGIKNNTGIKAELENTINKLLFDAQNLSEKCRVYKQETYSKLRNISLILLIGAIGLAVFLSLNLSKRITRRISLLSENISAFISSCFTVIEPVSVIKKDDEVGILIENFELLKQKISDQINFLELKVAERTEEINLQKEHILLQNKKLMDSLRYAMSIQEAILPHKNYIQETFREHFIFYRPKDLVSGDFYWFKRIENEDLDISVIAVADCTGHGVPGAFMSMLGIAFLNDIIIKKGNLNSAHVLNRLRKKVIENLSQQYNTKKISDGMDIGFTIIDHRNKKLQFSGAFRDLFLVRNNEIRIIKGDRMPIGKYIKENTDFDFTEIDYLNDDIIYMVTDGFADQYGGPKNSKYLRKKLKEFLLGISHEPFDHQKQLIERELNMWMRNNDQTDDILMAGFKLNC